MPAKDPLVYIMHIRDSCRRIAQYTKAGGNNWARDPLILDAVCRHITIIGEAARKLDDRQGRLPASFLHLLPRLSASQTVPGHANDASESAPATLYEPEGRQFESVRAHH
jgi:hypothetical protein